MRYGNSSKKLLVILLGAFVHLALYAPLASAQQGGIEEEEYLAEVRPGPSDKHFPVEIGIVVIDIDSIEGAQQSFVANFAVLARWVDPRLALDVDYTRIMDLDDIWTPSFQILNQQKLFETINDKVEVEPDGTVHYRQRFWGTLSYPMNLEDFPSDEHELQIRIIAIGKDARSINFIIDDELTGMGDVLTVTDWQIVGWRAFADDIRLGPRLPDIPGVIFEFEAKRLVTFYLVKILIPLGMIVLMSFAVFFIDPNNSGSRLSIAITAILTLIAYRFLLGNLLPKISYLTNMDYFIFGSMFLVFGVLIEACYVARLVTAGKVGQAGKIDYWSRWVFVILFVIIVIGSFKLFSL